MREGNMRRVGAARRCRQAATSALARLSVPSAPGAGVGDNAGLGVAVQRHGTAGAENLLPPAAAYGHSSSVLRLCEGRQGSIERNVTIARREDLDPTPRPDLVDRLLARPQLAPQPVQKHSFLDHGPLVSGGDLVPAAFGFCSTINRQGLEHAWRLVKRHSHPGGAINHQDFPGL